METEMNGGFITRPQFAADLIPLVLTDDEGKRRTLERKFGWTRDEAVNEFIERTCWETNPKIAPFVGNRGCAEARLDAFRTAYREQEATRFSV
jgi:hypothetical protein